MSNALPLFQVDAFARAPFTGNPAAVCLLDHPREDQWMQIVARQMNLSETAYLCPRGDGFDLRWFTHTCEVALCGHATLASAHVLWERHLLPIDQPARFHTKSGWLTAHYREGSIELGFPATPPEPAALPPELAQAIGGRIVSTWKSRFDFLLELSSEKEVRELKLDFRRLATLPVRGIIVTSKSSAKEYDFVSRFFCPGSGIDEDPATGSSHCALAPFWQERLGKDRMVGYQASERGGVIGVQIAGSRVNLSGKAFTIWRGELLV